ncbi:MAG: hypothetical protein KKC72_07505 [Alphaproteobacteria bacterium]|nr:hypothetical protein [Alphaproteobacteria bacterium]MBU1837107.1 hypothetical protein [Alphaproteobacteria bacterium]
MQEYQIASNDAAGYSPKQAIELIRDALSRDEARGEITLATVYHEDGISPGEYHCIIDDAVLEPRPFLVVYRRLDDYNSGRGYYDLCVTSLTGISSVSLKRSGKIDHPREDVLVDSYKETRQLSAEIRERINKLSISDETSST